MTRFLAPGSSYADRRAAGRALAEELRGADLPDPLVLALPRGGVPVAAEVASALGADLDVLVARKIGAPGHPELGVGALTVDGPVTFDERLLRTLGLAADDLAATVAGERAEAARRLRAYRGTRPPPRIADRAVIVVDDGLATGVTARAALHSLRPQDPYRLLLAVPVGAAEAVRALSRLADVVCPRVPRPFGAVGRWYDDFDQLDDEDVREILSRWQ